MNGTAHARRRPQPQRGTVSPLALHGSLAILATVGAFFAWTHDRTYVAEDRVVVLDVRKRDVVGVTYQEPDRTVTVEKKETDKGDLYPWVTVTTKKKDVRSYRVVMEPLSAPISDPNAGKAPAKGGDKAAAGKEGEKAAPIAAPAAPAPTAPAAPPAPGAAPSAASGQPAVLGGGLPESLQRAETITVNKSFRGGDMAEKLLDALAPLLGSRYLGSPDDEKLREYGLVDSGKVLTVQLRSRSVRFTVGGFAAGSGDIYVRSDEGNVYLMPSRFSVDFTQAEDRLMNERLHKLSPTDISRIEVKVNGKNRVLVHRNRTDPSSEFWADQASPDQRDEALRKWIEKVMNASASEYLSPEQEAKLAASVPAADKAKYGEVLDLRLFDGERDAGFVTLYRYPGKKPELYAKSSTTMSMVKLRIIPGTLDTALEDAEKW